MVKRIGKEAFPLLADNMTYDNMTKESTNTLLELMMVQIWIINRMESILSEKVR